MANSKYNAILLTVAEDLGKLVSGEINSVDLSNFKLVGNRKTWADKAEVVGSGDKSYTIGTVNVHMIAVGDVLGSLGYKGSLYLDTNFKLSLTKTAKAEQVTKVSLAAIIAAAKAEPVIANTADA